MHRSFLPAALAAIFSICALDAHAQVKSELRKYVEQCQTEVIFAPSDIQPLNCNNGVRFAGGGPNPINDFLVHQRLTENVDLLAACRWGNDISSAPFENTKFASIELLITNRVNGATCFFGAKDQNTTDKPVASAMVSPAYFGAGTNADAYWMSPKELNEKTLLSNRNTTNGLIYTDPIQCVGCHSGGAILASSRIAPALAQFGLLNNRHDTTANFTVPNTYRVVASNGHLDTTSGTHPLRLWNSIAFKNNNYSDCSSACHALGSKSKVGSLFIVANFGSELLPSIHSDIAYFKGGSPGMPPFEDNSPYRWVNLDTPDNGADTETFADVKAASAPPATRTIYEGCVAPTDMDAHAVGVDEYRSFSTSKLAAMPDRLRAFNLKDGLVCLNADQEPGNTCKQYTVAYYCDEFWQYTIDRPNTSEGDREDRATATGVCANPKAIMARVTTGATWAEYNGPSDRLARISPYGVTCNAADQPDGKCSNYVARYRACGAAPVSRQAHLVSAHSNRQLTATGTANNAPVKGQPFTQGWNTQNWELVPVTNTEYVRIRNTGTNTYLNASTQAESAVVGTHALNTGYDSQVWIVEPIKNSTQVRLKNLWSGKYLTVFDAGDYSPIYSQTLNPSWPTQRWIVQ